MSSTQTIVDRIRILANAQGLSLPNLEMRLNMGNGTISRWSKSSPNSDKLLRVADYFHVPIDYLLGREPSSYDSEYGKSLVALRTPGSGSAETSSGDWQLPCVSDEDMAAIHCVADGRSFVSLSPAECDIISRFRSLDDRGQAAVLNVLNHEYDSLPGEKANAPAKEA